MDTTDTPEQGPKHLSIMFVSIFSYFYRVLTPISQCANERDLIGATQVDAQLPTTRSGLSKTGRRRYRIIGFWIEYRWRISHAEHVQDAQSPE